MIPYEELAAALAGQRPVGRPIPQTTVIDASSAASHHAADETRMEQPPVLAPPPAHEDVTLNGLDGMTGEVDIGDVVGEEEV